MRSQILVGSGLALCLSLTTAPTNAEPRLESAATASAAADADLGLVELPPGTAVVATSPAPPLDEPPQTPAVHTLVEHTFWATTPGTVNDVLAYVDAHPPAGFVASGSGLLSVGGETTLYNEFGRGYFSDQTLLVTAFQAGSTVDLRVDAQIIWYPSKTTSETVPASVTSATFDYLGPLEGSVARQSITPRPRHAHRIPTGTVLRRVVADVDALQTFAPGEKSCPADDGELGRLRVTIDGKHVVFSIGFEGCGDVSVTSDGRAQPGLNGTRSTQLTSDLYAAIGVRFGPIPVTPPQGPPARTPPQR